MSHRILAAAGLAALVLQGCATPPPAVVVDQDDLKDGLAKTCSYSPIQPEAGKTVQATITMTNDGWCAYRASESKGNAYLLGLVRERPEHGELQVRKWAGESRVEYYPEARFVGTDKFLVALRPNSDGPDALVQVTATVSQGQGVPVAAPAPSEERAPATTTRRTTTRRTTTRRQ